MTGIGLAAIIGYLLGSIPFGVVLTRLAGLGDVRRIGSGSIGATNVLRTGNKALAALTLALDLAKGLAAALIGRLWGGDAMLAASRAVIPGHMFPVWLRFSRAQGRLAGDGLRLARPETVGRVPFSALLRRSGSGRAALDALPRLAGAVSAMSRRDAEAELAALDRLGASLVCWGEPDYPATLAAVEDAPP